MGIDKHLEVTPEEEVKYGPIGSCTYAANCEFHGESGICGCEKGSEHYGCPYERAYKNVCLMGEYCKFYKTSMACKKWRGNEELDCTMLVKWREALLEEAHVETTSKDFCSEFTQCPVAGESYICFLGCPIEERLTCPRAIEENTYGKGYCKEDWRCDFSKCLSKVCKLQKGHEHPQCQAKFPSLNALVHNTPEGGVLQLLSGEYRLTEFLVIDKPITIAGSWAGGRTRIVAQKKEKHGQFNTKSTGERALIVFKGNGLFALRELEIFSEYEQGMDLVRVEGGRIEFEECSFRFAKMEKDGREARFGTGLRLTGNTGGTVNHCCFSQNATDGISLEDDVRVYLMHNKCWLNGGSGIVYRGKSSGGCRENDCSSNKGAGIELHDRSAPLLICNSCSDNGQGVALYDEAAPIVRQNRIERNNGGIVVHDAAAPVLESNHLLLNTGDMNQSFAQRIMLAAPGEVIELDEGEYFLDETANITQPITLIGKGMGRTRILSNIDAAGITLLTFNGEGPFIMRDLSIEYYGNKLCVDIVAVKKGEIFFDSCGFKGAIGDFSNGYYCDHGYCLDLQRGVTGKVVKCQCRGSHCNYREERYDALNWHGPVQIDSYTWQYSERFRKK